MQEDVQDLFDAIPLNIRGRIIWQQDGAPAHLNNEIRQYLNEKYRCWIRRSGTPRSPDLTPMDLFLWGYLKNKVYEQTIENCEEIKMRIRQEIQHLNTRPDILC